MTGEPPDGRQRRGRGFNASFWLIMAIVVAICVGIAVFVSVLNG